MSKSRIKLKDETKIRFVKYVGYLTESYSSRMLIGIPFLLGLILITLWGLNKTLSNIQNFILVCITFFIWGFCGIVIIIKRELPGTFASLKGIYAIIIGAMVTIFFWGLAFRGAYLLLTNHIK